MATPTQDMTSVDKVLGIIIMLWNGLCGVCVGFFVTFLGGTLGALGGAAAAEIQKNATTSADKDAAAAVATGAAAGGMFMLIGVATILLSAIGVFGGFKMFKSERIGFIIVAATCGLAVIINVLSLNLLAIVGILINAALAVYAVMRLMGKLGTAPT